MQIRTIFASWSIRKKSLLFLLAIFLPVIGFIVASGLHSRSDTINTAENNALLLAQSVAAQQEKVALGTRQMLSTLSQLPMVQKLDAEACNKLFRELNQLYPSYSIISVITPEGNMVAASSPFEPGTVNLADRKHIKDAIKTGDFSAGEFIIGRVSKTPSINYTFPIYDQNHTLTAIVDAGFKLDEYADFIAKAKPPEGSAVIITDHAGIRLLRFPENDAAASGKPLPKDSFERVSGSQDHGFFERIGEDGIHRFYAFKQLRLKENSAPYLYVIVGFPVDKVLHRADLAMLGNLFILGIVALIEILLTWVFGSYAFIRPINRLVAASRQVGKGNLSIRTDMPHTADELGQLAKSFDEMALQLELRATERLQAEDALRQSEEQYRHLFEKQIDIYYRIDPAGKITNFSPSVEKILGYTPEEVLGSNIRNLYARPDDRDMFLAMIIKKGAVENHEIHVKGKDGSLRWLAVNARLEQDKDGNMIGIEGVARDITDRKTAEDKLAKVLHEQKIILDNVNIGISMTVDRKQIWMNRKVVDLFQYSREEMEGQTTQKLYPSQEAYDHLGSQAYPVLAQGRVYETEQLLLRRDGTSIWVRYNGKAVEPSDMSLGTIWLLEDITGRKRMEEALRESEELYRLLVTKINDGFFKTDAQGFLTFANDALARIYGFDSPEECVGKQIFDLVAPSGREAVRKSFSEDVSGGKIPTSLEIPTLRKNGEVILTEVKPTVVFLQDGTVITQGLLIDISERKRAEEALRISEERLALALKATRDAVWDWDLVTNTLYCSPRWWSMLGYAENELAAEPGLYRQLMHPDDVEQADNVYSQGIAGKESFELENRLLHKHGHYVPILTRGCFVYDDTGKAVRISGTNTDLTDKKKIEEEHRLWELQRQQIEKSESLSRMAGAVAHHFNNMLGAVIGNIELAVMDLPPGATTVELLSEAMKASQQAVELSSLMLTYLGQTVTKRELLDLSNTCRSSLPLLKITMQKNVALVAEFSSPGPTINANASQIQQLLSNVVTNAAESIGNNPGTINLRVSSVSLTEIPEENRVPVDWQPQGDAFACITVKDTGSGIEDKDIQQIFDPFFSTKFTGRGLGLPVALGIVRAHNGVITVESTAGRGSLFQVFLPLSLPQVPLRQKELFLQTPQIESGGTILLVEDEEIVRKMAVMMLSHLGFSVLEAKDGFEAVEIFKKQKEEISIVLCDLTMPRMNGWETLAAVRELVPDIPVILSSGYKESQVMAGDHPAWPHSYLSKPYRLKELRLAISRALINRTYGRGSGLAPEN